MSTKAFCPCGGGSNLILGAGTENQIFILITPAAINFFHQILKNCHFSVKKKKSFLTHMDLYDPTRPPRPSSTAECLRLIARLRGEQASAASWEPRPPFEAAEMDRLAARQAWKASANQRPATSVAGSAAANQRPSRHLVREMLTFKRQ